MVFDQTYACGSPNCVNPQDSIDIIEGSPITWTNGDRAKTTNRMQANHSPEVQSSIGDHNTAIARRSISHLHARDLSPAAVGGAFVGSVLGFLLIMLLALFFVNQRSDGDPYASDDEESDDPRIVDPHGGDKRDKGPALPKILVPPDAKVLRHGHDRSYTIVRNPRPLRKFGGRQPLKPFDRVYVKTRHGITHETRDRRGAYDSD